jgi:hypothetical protein
MKFSVWFIQIVANVSAMISTGIKAHFCFRVSD